MGNSAEYSGMTQLQMAMYTAAAGVHDDASIVIDSDDHFIINTETRTITNQSAKKELVKGDHNSERLTFEMDRYVEGHDMLTCNVIRVHYLNVNTPGVYDVLDIAAKADDDTKVVFTWLITSNVTREVGKIRFAIKFECVQDSGEITYKWGTKINEQLSCVDDIENSKTVVSQNLDILEQWKRDLFNASSAEIQSSVNAYLSENPPLSGATQEQAEQIQKNADDISKLSEEIVDLKENGTTGGGTSTGLSSEIKSALMTVVENIGLWKDGNGQAYIDNLRTALYNAPLSSITAVYNQSKTVYASDDLEVLRDDLTVTAIYTDGSSSILSDYTLSGTLTVGTSTVTVSKDDKTATFEVEVTSARVAATGITLDNTALSFTSSSPVQLTATVTPDNATDTVVWASSEEAVAKVSSDGTVTPVADGSCVISATAGDFTAECTVSVALPLSGLNIGNPVLMKDTSTVPHTSGLTEEELQGKWYNAVYSAWCTSLGGTNYNSNMGYIFLHPLTNGTFYIRMLGRSAISNIDFFAFSNADIGINPTAALGKVGSDYTDASVTMYASFDCECTDNLGRADMGEWAYVDGSGTTYTSAFVLLYKVTVPENVYVFMSAIQSAAAQFPGISETYPNMNDMYTIFESDPSANIMQIVE